PARCPAEIRPKSGQLEPENEPTVGISRIFPDLLGWDLPSAMRAVSGLGAGAEPLGHRAPGANVGVEVAHHGQLAVLALHNERAAPAAQVERPDQVALRAEFAARSAVGAGRR